MTKEDVLKKLALALKRLASMLCSDPGCGWGAKFELDLRWCQQLLKEGYSAPDVRELSASITHVYGGMGSFNDYYMPNSAPNSEDFDAVSREVYELALQLREVSSQ